MELVRKTIRTAQTYFPRCVDVKYRLQRLLRSVRRRPFEGDFEAIPLLKLGERPVCLDVGANRGQSIDAIRMKCPNAAIIAFEPNPRLADRLSRSYQNDSMIRVHPVGLGAKPQSAMLYVPSYNGFVFDGLASTSEQEAREWLPDRLIGFRPHKLKVDTIPCSVITLDSMGLNPAFIKVDVQGAELDVLKGARRTLERCHPHLLIEAPDDAVVKMLNALGYVPCAWRNGKLLPGEYGSPNTLFLQRNFVDAHIGS